MKRVIVIEPTNDSPPAFRVFAKEGRAGRSGSRIFAEGDEATNRARALEHAGSLLGAGGGDGQGQ